MSTFITKSDYGTAITENVLDRVIEYDDTMLDEAETQAISLAEGYLNARFDVTNIFNKTDSARHPVLVMYIVDITLYNLHSRIRPNQVPELRKDRYQMAIKWLEKVASGKIMPNGLPYPATEGEKEDVHIGSNTKRTNHIE